ncbi:E3 ubiquitin protein ligase RIE1-like isoform X2 [Typha latifolia]|uniref:E3 ubiquitin protein ligase RIE1-like isoform X2 n=1 Tax=Typha latifolia TaxID=4733 RepID=UPI003C2F957D
MEDSSSDPSPRTPRRLLAATAPLLLNHHLHLFRGGGAGARSWLRPADTPAEERHYDWGYSKPVVVLDVAWNLVFVLVAVSVLLSTAREKPSTPIRAWVFGYAIQCLMHAGFVCFEYGRRERRRRARMGSTMEVDVDVEEDELEDSHESRSLKKLESLNAMISFLWWLLGFYWIVLGGQALLQDAPHLYWLAVVFLAFDVFFAIFCIILACVVGIALCCCLPCILLFLSAVTSQGASDVDLSSLPRFRFHRDNQPGNFALREHEIVVTLDNQETADDLALPLEDSECCICLNQYEDDAELHVLPCNHHFHSRCIIKWLRINATCPLCKYNILEGDELV